MMWYWGGGMHWWGWLLGSLGMIFFWALVIWAVWYVATSMTRGSGGPTPGRRGAKELLDERLARGEIDPEEYERLRDLLLDRAGSRTNGHRSAATPTREG